MSFADRKNMDLKDLGEAAARLAGRTRTLAPLLEQLQSADSTAKEFGKTLERYPVALDKVVREQESVAQEIQNIQRDRVSAQESVEDEKEQVSRGLRKLCESAAQLALEFSTPIELPKVISDFLSDTPARPLYLSELKDRVDSLSELNMAISRRLENLASEYASDKSLPFLFTTQQGTPFESVAQQVAFLSSDLRRLDKRLKQGQSVSAQILSYLDREDELQQQVENIQGKYERLKQGELLTLEQFDNTRRQMRELGQTLVAELGGIIQELVDKIARYHGASQAAGIAKSSVSPVMEILAKEQALDLHPSSPLMCAALAQRFWNVTLVCSHLERMASKAVPASTTQVDGSQRKSKEFDSGPRFMIPRDVPEVVAIEALSFREPWARGDLLDALRPRSVIGNVITADDAICGYMVWEIKKHSFEILRLAVHPTYRYLGMGRCFVEKLIEKVEAPGSRRSRVYIDVPEESLEAQLFLRQCGFRAVSISEGGLYRMEYNKADHQRISNTPQ